MIDPEAELDQQLDAFVDQGRGSYADAFNELGAVTPDNGDFTATAILARNPGQQFAPDDLAHYGVNHAGYAESYARDPRQRERDQAGIAAARKLLTEVRHAGNL